LKFQEFYRHERPSYSILSAGRQRQSQDQKLGVAPAYRQL
jgi:hypothetical protein